MEKIKTSMVYLKVLGGVFSDGEKWYTSAALFNADYIEVEDDDYDPRVHIYRDELIPGISKYQGTIHLCGDSKIFYQKEGANPVHLREGVDLIELFRH